MDAKRVLEIEDLHVSFDTYAGEVKAVRGVSLHVDAGEVRPSSASRAVASP